MLLIRILHTLWVLSFIGLGALSCCSAAIEVHHTPTAGLFVNSCDTSARLIPDTLFGIFFEEINHAGAGGLWAELVSNRGFEAGGQNIPSNIYPWSVIGNESMLIVATDHSSCFHRNKIALQMKVLCNIRGPDACPPEGVGIYNPGFWGMNIEEGKMYKLVLYVRSLRPVNLSVSLTDSQGVQKLATANIIATYVFKWTKVEILLKAKGSNYYSRLQLTTRRKGVAWFDQVSLMPLDTYKGHGFRNDLFQMIKDLKPGFLRFPGGCFVEGDWLMNAYRWKETVGPWEERPGHFGDVWKYWTDDGFGHFEFLQLAEDLGTVPIWVFNNGISHNDQVNTSVILPFVQEVLDGLEFARGCPKSRWGSLRAAMGHPAPFNLKYVAIGNEDCEKYNYRGNYLKFYDAIRQAYPDIKIISNCDASRAPLDHPADLYDYHIYSDAKMMFARSSYFDQALRNGPKAFVSEYAVTNKTDAGTGSLFAALAEAGFAIGLEKNSDLVNMASYAPLYVNVNDRRWNPDAIVFNASHAYGTPSYWMQHFFKDSNGATLLDTSLRTNLTNQLVASTIIWQNPVNMNKYLRVKIVNFGNHSVDLQISIDAKELNIQSFGSTSTILTSSNVKDENSLTNPTKVVPATTPLQNAGKEMNIKLSPYSLYSLDLLTTISSVIDLPGSDIFNVSSN